MATATVSPDQKVKTSTETWEQAYGFQIEKTKDKDGKEVITKEPVVISVDKAEELEKQGKFEGGVVTCRVDYPSNLDSLIALAKAEYKDEDGNPRDTNEVQSEIVKLFINGAKGKIMNRLKARLTKTNEAGQLAFSDSELTDGVLDLTGEITSGSKRVFLTEEQKTWKNLSNLPDELRKQMFDVYLTSIGKEKGNYPEV